VSDDLADHTQFTVYFHPNPAALGTYTLVLGPHIKDLAGNEMDQNGNAVVGEAEDAYTATFNIVRAPDLVVTAASAEPLSTSPTGSVTVSWTVANRGDAATSNDNSQNASWYDTVFLSDTPTYDPDTAVYLGTFSHYGALAARPEGGADDETNRYSETATVTIPGDAGVGTKYLLVVADVYDYVSERDGAVGDGTDTNNIGAIQITLNPLDVDLAVTGTTLAADTTVSAGDYLYLSYTVANHGASATTAYSWQDGIYLSDTATFDPSTATRLTYDSHYGDLGPRPAGGSMTPATVTRSITPRTTGGGTTAFTSRSTRSRARTTCCSSPTSTGSRRRSTGATTPTTCSRCPSPSAGST
jgi:hypothetical protein